MACTSTSSPKSEADETAGRVLPVSTFTEEPRILIWPLVELIPENALQFRLHPKDAQSVAGPVFAIFEVRGDQAYERMDALERWHWNGDGTRVRLEPKGLKRGAPYLLTAEDLHGKDGPYAVWAHPFRVIGPDETSPDGSSLRAEGAPLPGTTNRLHVRFEEPMHEASVHSLATLVGGKKRPEVWTLSPDQRVMTFTPETPWSEGDVRVAVGSNLRDLAGNPIANVGSRLLMPQVPVE